MSHDASHARESDAPGDGSLAAVLQRQLPALEAFIRRRVPPLLSSKESSTDLAQSVCREFLAGIGGFEFRGEAAFRAMLFTMAMHKIQARLRYYRAARRACTTVDGRHVEPVARADATPSRVAMGREWLREFELAFAGLPVEYQEVLTLARVFKFRIEDVAVHMDRSVPSVKGLLRRATSRLKPLIERM